MAIIKVNTEGIAGLCQMVDAFEGKAESALNYVLNAKQTIDINTASSEAVSARLNSIQKRLTTQQNKLIQYKAALTSVNDNFSSADKAIAGKAKDTVYLLGKISAWNPAFTTRNTLKIVDEQLENAALVDTLGFAATGTLLTASSLALSDVSASFDETGPKRIWGSNFSYGSDDMTFGVLNYSSDDDAFRGSLLEFSDESKVGEFSSQKATIAAGVVTASCGSSFSLFGLGQSKNEKEGFKYSSQDGLTEYDGSVSSKTSADLVDIGVKADVGVSVLAMDYEQTLGSEDLNFEVGADLKLLNADAGFDFGIKCGEDGFEGGIGAEAGASLAEVSASGGINVGDAEFKTTVSAEVGIGLSASVKYTRVEGLEVNLGAALGIGGKIKFTIKFW